MYEYLEGQITSDVSSVLFVGLCKDSIASLMLAIRLHATHPELSVGVFGCAWAGDYTGSTPTYHGQSLSSLHTKIQHQYPYDTLLNQCDPLILLNNQDTAGIKLYGFYCKDLYWNMDELSTERLGKRLSKIYNSPPPTNPTMSQVHACILSLAQQQPQLVTAWINEMFDDLSNTSSLDTTPPGRVTVSPSPQ
ncbi:MAG: hypothetical protein RR382_00475 [Tannerellaceae bacterium]